MLEMLKTMKVNKDVMAKAVQKGFLTATDLVYYLVRKGVAFRAAHEIVGKIISYCEESNMDLAYVSLSQLKEFSDKFSYDVTRYLTIDSSVASKDIHGGTAPDQVKGAIKRARNDLLHGKA